MFGEARLVILTLLLLASILMRHGLLFVVVSLLLLTALVARLWERYCLDRLEYRRHFSQRRALFGEEIELVVEIVNRKPLPLAWLEIEDDVPRPLRFRNGDVVPSHKEGRSVLRAVLALRWYERVRRHYRLRCEARGYHVFGPARLRSGDVFGFATRETTLAAEDYLLVYPRIVPLTRLGLPAHDPFGDRRSPQWIFEDPARAVGVRDYQRGDSPRRIHWPATARAQKLQVKLLEPTTTYQLVIFLNLNTHGGHWWHQGYNPDRLEQAISVAASVAHWAVEAKYQVGLAANGRARLSDQRVLVPPSRDPAQLTHVLEALARVLPFATLPLEDVLRQDTRGLAYGSTLVVVTAVLGEEIAARLLALAAAGHRVALLLIGDEQPRPRLPGIAVYRIGAEATWRHREAIEVGMA